MGRVVPQKVSEQMAECLLQTEVAARINARSDAKSTAKPRRIRQTLARGSEFQRVFWRFIPFNENRQKTSSIPILAYDREPSLPGSFQGQEVDFLDRLAGISDRIRPYSIKAIGIALASLFTTTVLQFAAGWVPSNLYYETYIPGILATGLLAGVPCCDRCRNGIYFNRILGFRPPTLQLSK
jgi:hypothetical protein